MTEAITDGLGTALVNIERHTLAVGTLVQETRETPIVIQEEIVYNKVSKSHEYQSILESYRRARRHSSKKP